MQRSKVVLPAPLGPIKATSRPLGTFKFTPWRIGTRPSVRRRSLTSMASGSLLFGARRCMIDQGAFQNSQVFPHSLLIRRAAQFAILKRAQRRDPQAEILGE